MFWALGFMINLHEFLVLGWFWEDQLVMILLYCSLIDGLAAGVKHAQAMSSVDD